MSEIYHLSPDGVAYGAHKRAVLLMTVSRGVEGQLIKAGPGNILKIKPISNYIVNSNSRLVIISFTNRL